jgi:mono/diheme cytochrome c family protein
MQNKGAILAFTYIGEGTGTESAQARPVIADQDNGGTQAPTKGGTPSGESPRFTAEQAAAGKVAYNSNCAVCHGNTMTNGTFAPPLAGEYFKTTWSGRTVRSFYDKAASMPPAAPASLGDDTYANIVAHILQTNGATAGEARLPSRELLDRMTIR